MKQLENRLRKLIEASNVDGFDYLLFAELAADYHLGVFSCIHNICEFVISYSNLVTQSSCNETDRNEYQIGIGTMQMLIKTLLYPVGLKFRY